ncbi:uncharacterized protein BO95DRAFT_445829 [Aspergillus brunneoviolaceus CBS 621.78]|uniref:Uncharacterized protein n=1 Tax=Aspergillus brunneoviolaceus CBS 621.78 TaxID=1450534 RepID=A0ACD1G0N7_9EURO|nr:hypothetical protein BO95DRAFT_445829 [Aspergillus brunneoviolaceus CBS 621.78]RAH42721.1 hypothetical protein BO95DRAFT_445829 [Aspergillus brunneoviolaceus CBS 621.78]
MSCCIRSCTSRPEQLAVKPLSAPLQSVRLGNLPDPLGSAPGSQATAPSPFSGPTLTPESLRPPPPARVV